MQNFVICEDDQKQASYLKKLVTEHTKSNSIVIYTEGKNLMQDLNKFPVGSIFLMDIVLTELSGIEIAKCINSSVPQAIIIFISAYLEKVTDIYDATHCYFVFKPEMERRLPLALDRALEMSNSNNKTIVIEVKEKKILLYVSEIQYFERVQRTTFIYTTDKIYRCAFGFDHFVNQLPSYFVQSHRSFIVNFNYVLEYMRTDFLLSTGVLIPISRSYGKNVNEVFLEFIMKKAG